MKQINNKKTRKQEGISPGQVKAARKQILCGQVITEELRLVKEKTKKSDNDYVTMQVASSEEIKTFEIHSSSA